MLKRTFPFCRMGSHIPFLLATHTYLTQAAAGGNANPQPKKKKREKEKCWECWVLAKSFTKVERNGQNTSKPYSQAAS